MSPPKAGILLYRCQSCQGERKGAKVENGQYIFNRLAGIEEGPPGEGLPPRRLIHACPGGLRYGIAEWVGIEYAR